ncbi:helix-turn-helix domain-containing protein [Kitasatospora sp. NPDC059648]|uniref:helix-turn-helix domain-containing protein n=1 Tax=Kitasatospora sp. NPDC059648 TaxID=3346894 RepID=UPI0036A0F75A
MTDAERAARERIRLQAVERFEGGEKNREIATALRVSDRSVERWLRQWRERGEAGVLSKGSPGRPRLSRKQIDAGTRVGARSARAWLGRPALDTGPGEDADRPTVSRQPHGRGDLGALNPQEGIWALVKRGIGNLAAANVDHLAKTVRTRLKKIQYRPHLIDGCLAQSGLDMNDWPQPTPSSRIRVQ